MGTANKLDAWVHNNKNLFLRRQHTYELIEENTWTYQLKARHEDQFLCGNV